MTPDLTEHDALARHCIRARDAIRRRVTTARAGGRPVGTPTHANPQGAPMTPHLFVLPAQSTEAQARQCQRFMAELAGHPSALDPDEYDEPDPCPPSGIARPDLRIVR